MSIFKTKLFHQWAKDIGLSDDSIKIAVKEISERLFDANLGGSLYKKRIGIGGKGKSGGIRTIIAFKYENKAFCVYGFKKNKRANIGDAEVKIYKKLAKLLFTYSNKEINIALRKKELIEVL